MNWLYEDKEFTDVEDFYGFIYLIENLVNGKKYETFTWEKLDYVDKLKKAFRTA